MVGERVGVYIPSGQEPPAAAGGGGEDRHRAARGHRPPPAARRAASDWLSGREAAASHSEQGSGSQLSPQRTRLAIVTTQMLQWQCPDPCYRHLTVPKTPIDV